MSKDFEHQYIGKWLKEKDKIPVNEKSFLIIADSENQIKVSDLNEVLHEVGIKLELGDGDGKFQSLSIKINFDTFAKQKHRGAGRRKKSRKLSFTVGQIKEMKKTMKHEEIMEQLGIPRATYYRAWKEVKDNDRSDDFYFLE